MKKYFARLLIAASGMLAIPSVLQAEVVYDIKDPAIAARYGDLEISSNVLKMYWKAYHHPNRPMSPVQALQKILDDALLAEYARSEIQAELLQQENKVGFLKDVQREDRLMGLIKKTYQKDLVKAIEALPNHTLDSITKYDASLTQKAISKVLKLKSGLRLEATPEQQDKAKQFKLATVTLNDAGKKVTHTISLWDVYRRQNVQGRLAMHKGDVSFIKQQIKQYVGQLFIINWAENTLGNKEVNVLRQLVLNEQDAKAYLIATGLRTDMHKDNPVLREKAKQVSQKDIKQYYQEHKDEFAVVNRVKARHIRLASQDLADKVHHKIEHDGLSFEKAIKKYSIAGDKKGNPAGSLGWLNRSDKKKTLLHSIAFSQKKGAVSSPFRTPLPSGEVVYEIVKVDDREDGYLDITDPTVSYEASRHVALEKMKHEYVTLKKRLRDKATIHLNQQQLKPKK